MTEAETRALVLDLAAAFPLMGPETVEVYVRYLKDLSPAAAVAEAVEVLICTESSLPPVALVRETVTRGAQRRSERLDGDGDGGTTEDVARELSTRLQALTARDRSMPE